MIKQNKYMKLEEKKYIYMRISMSILQDEGKWQVGGGSGDDLEVG